MQEQTEHDRQNVALANATAKTLSSAPSTVPYGVGYPAWLRNRVLFTAGSKAERSERTGVSLSTVYRLDWLWSKTGSVERLPRRAGRKPGTSSEADDRLKLLTTLAPGVYRSELVRALNELTPYQYKVWTITRRWRRLGFTKKKLRIHSFKRNEERRVRFWVNGPTGPQGTAGVRGEYTGKMIDIDEAGFMLCECDRTHGHALKGQRAEAPGFVRCFACVPYF